MTTLFDTIEKPTLLINEARARANIEWMAERAARAGARFRPHFKTHQSHEIGRWFREAGTRAITVSSLDMARYFIADGWDDVTLAFSANLRQMGTMNALLERARLNLLVEAPEVEAALEAGLERRTDAWIKVDVGNLRTGIPAEQVERIVDLARAMRAGKKLAFQGILTHAGQTYHACGPDEVRRMGQAALAALVEVRVALRAAGFTEALISYGDTPSCSLLDDLAVCDELRPGNFVLFDAMQYGLGACGEEKIAAAVACPVVALHPERDTVVLYGGAVHISKETFPWQGAPAYGLVALPGERGWGPALAGARLASLSQEHGLVQVPREWFARLRVGDLLVVLPAHSCLVVDLFRRYLTLDGRSIDAMGR